MDLVKRVLNGDPNCVSRLLTLVESESPQGADALDLLFPHTGKAHMIGITGPSGSGKSTLVNRLAVMIADTRESKVGIIAVDPTSPFSGGALLGDRVRMRYLAPREDIFIRSMATRGALGGLAGAIDEAVLVLDAAGYDPLLIETVGAGQSEVDIARLAHTTVVVEVPGLGDDIQAAKAGILEIADILVVNKSDRPQAQAAASALKTMLELGEEIRQGQQGMIEKMWKVPLVMTSALNGDGVADVYEAIADHRRFLLDTDGIYQQDAHRMKDLLERLIRERLFNDWQAVVHQERYAQLLDQVSHRKLSPRMALKELLGDVTI